MNNVGTVVRILGEKHVEVLVRRETACGHNCENCGGCSQQSNTIRVTAYNTAGAVTGDTVMLESGSAELLKLAAVVYILPIILFFAGWSIHPVAGIAGALAGVCTAVLVNRRIQRNGGVRISVTKILESAGC